MAIIPPRNPIPSTLNRYGVSSSVNGVTGGVLMPKLKHRFRVQLNNFGFRGIASVDVTKQVVTAGRPQIQHNNTPMHSYNNIVYYANKPEWQAVEITLRDDINNQVSQQVSAQLQRQMNHFTQSAAASHVNYKFECLMQTLDGSMAYPNNVIEEWFLEGCFLEQVQYDQMDYSSSDPTIITLTVRYDNATQGNEPTVPLGVAGQQ